MKTQSINLRHFFALVDIAATGRLSAAAEQLFMTQSALTQALRKLEDLAGVALFQRAGFGVTVTPAGKPLLRRAVRATDLLAQAERDIRSKHAKIALTSPLHRQVTNGQLQALIAIVETGGYSLAARELGLAQPTVYRAAKQLEATVGTTLFVPANRGVMPSQVAKHLARYAALVLAEVRQGFEQVRELQGSGDSRVAVGCLPLARSEFLPTVITELLSSFPDARVQILEGPYSEQLQALRFGQIDWLIGALRDPAPTSDVKQQALFDQPLAVVVRPGHPLLNANVPTVAALAKLEWVLPKQPAPAREFFDTFFQKAQRATPQKIIECSSLIATRGLLRRSNRAALLSPLQVQEDVAAGELALLINAIPNSSRSIGITTRVNWEPTEVQSRFTKIVHDVAHNTNP